jgi:hypothetical protein
LLKTLVSRGQQTLDEESESESLDQLNSLLEKLTRQYSGSTIADLGFQAADNWDRKTAEGLKRCLKVEVLLNVCEALMEFVTVHGADRDVRMADQLIGKNALL